MLTFYYLSFAFPFSVICRGYCGELARVISRDWNARAREHRHHGTGDAPTQSPDPKPEAGAQANPLQREVHALGEVPESTNPLCQPWRAARPATTKTTPSNTCSSTILLDTRILAMIVWPRKEVQVFQPNLENEKSELNSSPR